MNERFMELARDHQDNLERKALEDVRAQANALMPPDWDGKTCYDCGSDIPKKRLDLVKWTCVSCQEARERGSRLFRR
jgi:RNA polymerase-binding transcription factor DksA